MIRLVYSALRQAGSPLVALLTCLIVCVVYLAWSGRNLAPILEAHDSGYLPLNTLAGAVAASLAVTSTWIGVLVCSGFVALVRGWELQHGATTLLDLYQPSRVLRMISRGIALVLILATLSLVLSPAVLLASRTATEADTDMSLDGEISWSWVRAELVARWLLAVLLWWLIAELLARITSNVIGTFANMVGLVAIVVLLSNSTWTQWLPVRWTALVVGGVLDLNKVTALWPEGGQISAVTLKLAILVGVLGAIALPLNSRFKGLSYKTVEYTE